MQKLEGALLQVIANKQDVPGAKTVAEITEILELDKIRQYREFEILEYSAVRATTEETQKMMVQFFEKIRSRLYPELDPIVHNEESQHLHCKSPTLPTRVFPETVPTRLPDLGYCAVIREKLFPPV